MDNLEKAQQYLERMSDYPGMNTSIEHLAAVVSDMLTLRAENARLRAALEEACDKYAGHMESEYDGTMYIYEARENVGRWREALKEGTRDG